MKSATISFFLSLVDKFLADYVSFLAYCLLPNHFHFVIKLNKSIKIPSPEKDGISLETRNEEDIGRFVSNQFRRLFISYTMAINKQEERTGSIFDKNFKRLEITENEYLLYVIFYTHYNPEKHGITTNFRDYQFCSYPAIISEKESKISRNLALELFEGKDSFVNYHTILHGEKKDIILE